MFSDFNCFILVCFASRILSIKHVCHEVLEYGQWSQHPDMTFSHFAVLISNHGFDLRNAVRLTECDVFPVLCSLAIVFPSLRAGYCSAMCILVQSKSFYFHLHIYCRKKNQNKVYYL